MRQKGVAWRQLASVVERLYASERRHLASLASPGVSYRDIEEPRASEGRHLASLGVSYIENRLRQKGVTWRQLGIWRNHVRQKGGTYVGLAVCGHRTS